MSFRFPRAALTAGLVALALGGACARRHGSSEGTGSTTQAAESPPAQTPGVAAGQELYQRYCQLCHAADGSGYAADNAPSLVSRTFLESASDAFIAHGIRAGRPNTAMAAYGTAFGGPLDEAQIAKLVAFLRTKGPKPKTLAAYVQPATADVKRGAELFEKECKTCHGDAQTRGTALSLHNPELLVSAPPAFLRYAIEHGRPPTPMPAFGQKLSAAQIEDVMAWLGSLRPATGTSPVANTKVPDNLPVVVNPRGQAPKFTLREGRYVSAEQVKRALDEKRRIILLDARSPADWLRFHIPGAIPAPYHDSKDLERIPNDGTWVVAYCACPHHASGEVIDSLRRRNYPNTAVLDEGILFWRERGYPLAGQAALPPAPAASAPQRPW